MKDLRSASKHGIERPEAEILLGDQILLIKT
jgi:hypothetical protein